MKKLSAYQIQEKYPHLSTSNIDYLTYSANQLITELRELHNFFAFYNVQINETFNNKEFFSSKMVHAILSFKKRLDYLNKHYKNTDLVCVITLLNELDETQLQKHWDDFFLWCDALHTSILNLLKKRLSYTTDKSYNAEDISNQSMNDELAQLISQISELMLKTDELAVLVSNSKPNKKQTSIASIIPTKEEHLFFSLPEEIKVSILTHLDIEDLITVQIASKDLSQTASKAFEVRLKNPAQVIAHLSQIAAEEAYSFVEGYRRTSEYKALKSLVEHKMPMSDQEVICYMLTRHHKQLPDIKQLRNICNAAHIDSKTRTHLVMLIENTLEVDIADPAKAYALFNLFHETFPNNYINLLPSIEFYYIGRLIGRDLSHAPLSHAYMSLIDMSATCLFRTNLSYADLVAVCFDRADLIQANLSYANLRYSTFTQANLKQANLRGADLSGAKHIS